MSEIATLFREHELNQKWYRDNYEDLVERIVSIVDVVIHCAAQTSVAKSVQDPLFDAENTVIGTSNLLEAARRWRSLGAYTSVVRPVIR